MSSIHRISISDPNTFISSGLQDHGDHWSTPGARQPATLDVPVPIEAGTLAIDSIEVCAFCDLGPAPLIPGTEKDASGKQIMVPMNERHGSRSLVSDGGNTYSVENRIALLVLDSEGRALSGDLFVFSSRTPQTVKFRLQEGHRIMLPLDAQQVTLRLAIHGAVKRIARVRASVTAQLADSPKPEGKAKSRHRAA